MSLSSSRDKYRILSRGSLLSFESPRESSQFDRSVSSSTLLGQQILASSHSDGNLLSLGKRSDRLSSAKSAKSRFYTYDSNDLGVVPEDASEDITMPTPALFPSKFDNEEEGQRRSQDQLKGQQVWYEIRDVKSKKIFYFEAVSQISQWKRPEGVTIIPINQRGVAIILGNGVIEKDYLSASSRWNGRQYLNEEDHIYDPVDYVQKQLFTEDESHSEVSITLGDETPQVDSISKADSQLKYEHFVETYFNYHRRGLFKTRTTTEKLMSYKPVPIRLPLLKAASAYRRESIELNKRIIHYVTSVCNVNSTGRSLAKDYHSIREIIKIALNNYQGLRNEVYCQVLKVLRGGSELTILAAWDLLGVLCGTIAPTEVLLPYILAECHRYGNNSIHSLPLKAENLLKKTMVLKARSVIPTNAEINAILNDEYVAVRVYLYNGDYLMLRVKPGMTVGELDHVIAEKMHLEKHERLFCLYECCDDELERKCDSEEQVLVIVSKWQIEFSSKHHSKEAKYPYHFLYHCVQFIDFDRTDRCMLEMMFIQACHDMKRLLYPCTEVDMVTLLALYVKACYGDCELSDEQYQSAYEEFIPSSSRNYVMFDKLKRFCKKLKNRERRWYLCAYVDYVMNWELYGIVCFPVEVIGRTDMREESILAIGMHGVFLLQPETKLIQREIPFEAIPCWGYTKDSILLYVGSFVHQEKMVFGTRQGKEINDLLQNYVTYLTEQHEATETH